MKILDIGCGRHKTPGAIGLDSNPRSDADVIHDLDTIPYPFPDGEFDLIVGNQVIEHVADVLAACRVQVVGEEHQVSQRLGRTPVLGVFDLPDHGPDVLAAWVAGPGKDYRVRRVVPKKQ